MNPKVPPTPARLDANKTAKPLTEIVGVFEEGKTNWYHNVQELVVRPIERCMHYAARYRECPPVDVCSRCFEPVGYDEGAAVAFGLMGMAEAIRNRCTCLTLKQLVAKRGPGHRTWDEVCERCKRYP